MSAESTASAPAGQGGAGQPNHGMRIFLIWIVLAIVADLLIWFALGPHLPPGTMTSTARDSQQAIKLMAVLSAPVMVGVWVYFAYALTVWRRRGDDTADGPPIHGHTGIQTFWIAGTTVVVLALAVYGTVALWQTHGSGSGQGQSPIFNPPGTVSDTSWSPGTTLDVQVVAQQWKFTYRYPQFGGFETTSLVLPDNTWVKFNVTSLDVIHSFWAYQLGVKADANPGVNNVAYTKTEQLGTFIVRCAELCGLWHGAMFNNGTVVTVSQFQAWASATSAQLASVTKLLPPYATVYDPTQIKTLGSILVKLGLSGAGGGYYSPADPSQP